MKQTNIDNKTEQRLNKERTKQNINKAHENTNRMQIAKQNKGKTRNKGNKTEQRKQHEQTKQHISKTRCNKQTTYLNGNRIKANNEHATQTMNKHRGAINKAQKLNHNT